MKASRGGLILRPQTFIVAFALLGCGGSLNQASIAAATSYPPVPEPAAATGHDRAPLVVAQSARWVAASRGSVPAGATSAGVEQPPGNEPLWACRARHAGPGKRPGVHPGKVGPHLGNCNVGYGGDEILVGSYEVLTSPVGWIPAAGGQLPPRALRAGVEGPDDGGEALYLCRATYPAGTTGLHVGKIRPGFQGCNLGWGGREVVVSSYEVAVEP